MTSAPFQDLDLQALDDAVEAAIARGSAGDLAVIGYGDVTLVIAWPAAQPRYAVKRLQAFPSQARFDAYEAMVARYIVKLAERGVGVVPTEVRGIAAGDGTVRGYIIQPLVAKETLLTHILRQCDERRARELLGGLVDTICAAVDAEVGIDAAVPNWALVDGRLETFDISTPWLRDASGRDLIDLEHLMLVYPSIVRGLLRVAFVQKILDGIHVPRSVIKDTASNLLRWDNAKWLDVFLELANSRLKSPLSRKEVEDYHAEDMKMYPHMHKLRVFDRWWKRVVRRRPYGTLLPPAYTRIRHE